LGFFSASGADIHGKLCCPSGPGIPDSLHPCQPFSAYGDDYSRNGNIFLKIFTYFKIEKKAILTIIWEKTRKYLALTEIK
jgi:hypothetical protein